MVTVPTFGFGIRPRGPSTLPRRPTSGIMSGVAMQRSKSIVPFGTLSTRSSAPTMSAPAFLASSALAPRANTATRSVAARAVRQVADAADHLVGVTRIDAEVHRDLDGLVELGVGALLDQADGLGERIELGAVDALTGLDDALSDMCHDRPLSPRLPGPWTGRSPRSWPQPNSTLSQFRSAIFFSAISLQLRLRDLADIAAAAGRLRTRGQAGGLLQEIATPAAASSRR